MSTINIVVVGAGVTGLTTALLLSKNRRYSITIAAKHMPGDYDIEYASPWAGADYLPVSIGGTDAAQWDRDTWPYIFDLAQNHPEAGIHFQRTERYHRKKDLDMLREKGFKDGQAANAWWAELFPDLEKIPRSKLKPDIDNAIAFTSVCINTAIYLPWLVSQCLKAGVTIQRARFERITEAAAVGIHASGDPADLVVNCTGLSSLTLGGVEDKALFPTRGQIALVRNDPGATFSMSSTDDGPEEAAYLMKRAAGGGTVLGGCTQENKWESQVDPSLALRIMKRAVEICPRLTDGQVIEKLYVWKAKAKPLGSPQLGNAHSFPVYRDVVRHAVGLRPSRHGGARIERQFFPAEQIWVVHNYGHGGAGYQCSYGCAEVAVKLVSQTVDSQS